MNKISPDKESHIKWLSHEDIRQFIKSNEIHNPWFPAYRRTDAETDRLTLYSALVPPSRIQDLVKGSASWDLHLGHGGPAIWTRYIDGGKQDTYCPFGNEEGFEPLVIYRGFHGIRPNALELSQEFILYHSLYREPSRRAFTVFDDDGNESDAVRYDDHSMEIRTDLLLKFCAVKQMALAVYVDGSRYSSHNLNHLKMDEVREDASGAAFQMSYYVLPDKHSGRSDRQTIGHIIGKKYVLPGPMPTDDDEDVETYQEFTIDSDPTGKLIRHTCDPEQLSNYFGKNPGAPHYLTPVFFRPEVLAKYYADPDKFTVEDGHLQCAGLWSLRLDNDHTDFVVVWLGDLGTYLSESERNYWLSFNIAPDGRRISETNFRRGFMAEFTDPKRPDLVFKQEYAEFSRVFFDTNGWNFFLPLHSDDEHFFRSLRVPLRDSQAEFDSQLLAITKVIVDSLNEAEISKGLRTLDKGDKGITKLEKFLSERGATDFDLHIKFLRVLQDFRSKGAAHRKGEAYNNLISDLRIGDVGQQETFSAILRSATEFMKYLSATLTLKKRD